MQKILISNLKGGVGKSTTAINLAYALDSFLKVAILDLDSQLTATDFAKGFPIFQKIEEVSDDIQVLIIDGPPYISDKTKAMSKSADLIVIPTLPSFADYLSTLKTVNFYKEHSRSKIVIFINQEDKRTDISDVVAGKFGAIEGISVLRSRLGYRVSFKKSIALENGIFSTNDSKAIDEFNSLTKELLSNLIDKKN